jgi:cytochrome oxidase Cu insertion factor (SCO1/SenC/PrrC family)
MKNLFLLLIILGVVAMVTVSASAEQNKTIGTSVIGLKFPTLTTDSLAGTKVTLPDSAKGKVTLVIMSFKRDSQSQNDSWLGPFEKEFGQKEGYLF